LGVELLLQKQEPVVIEHSESTKEYMPSTATSSVKSRVAFFEKIYHEENQVPSAVCGSKREREVESITSPGIVREVREKLLTPTNDTKPSGVDSSKTSEVSPGRVRQVVETMKSFSRWVKSK
jgi:hypothetical protein